MSFLHSNHQRRLSRDVCLVDADAASHESPHALLAVVLGGVHEWRVAVDVDALGICVVAQQQLQASDVT